MKKFLKAFFPVVFFQVLFLSIFLSLMSSVSFAASDAVLQSLTVDKTSVLANNSDLQTATLIFSTTDPSSIERVSILVNHLDDSGNPARGYMSWYESTGFKEENGYGAEYIDLQIADCTTQVGIDTFTIIFKWTCTPTYGQMANNDIAYYAIQDSSVIGSGWQNHDTNFDVNIVLANLQKGRKRVKSLLDYK
ncbi:MAG: hypothetical protein ABII88_10810 [Candidatus Omnitrophota bacterium]